MDETGRVRDAASLAAFIQELRRDEAVDGLSLDAFLDQMAAAVVDHAGSSSEALVAEEPSWRFAAQLLLTAAVHE
jgi:hypothetical protein